MSETFSFTDTRTKHRPSPSAKVFESIKNAALGKRYDLSLAFVSKSEMRRINRQYRGKDKPTNVLSFPLDATSGEIFICPSVITPDEMLPLFIHGLIHLKGFDHGSKMEDEERQISKKFGVR